MMNRWKMLHPATMYFLLTVIVVLLSWVFDIYGMHVDNPATGESIQVQSLLGAEGIRWYLRNAVSSFTGFAPLGMVLVALLGLGVAEHSGLVHACIRAGIRGKGSRRTVVLAVILAGILSNVVGDAGYIFLLPLAAVAFRATGLPPVSGVVTAYVAVACGFSANVFCSTLEPLLARSTLEASLAAGLDTGNAGELSNYYFMFASTFVLTAILYKLSIVLSARLERHGEAEPLQVFKPVSRKERRGLAAAAVTGLFFLVVVVFATFSPWGILRGVTGGMIRSPFISGALFLFSFCLALMGMAYGFVSGRYRADADVVSGLESPMRLFVVYLVIAFFASQMFACLEYSCLDKCLLIGGASRLSAIHVGGWGSLLLFVLFSAVANLLVVSSTAKWSLFAFVFIPAFAAMGIGSDEVQCAYRIGDSMTNAVTPFMFYMPWLFACMRQYDEKSNYLTVLCYTWRYSLFAGIGWILLFVIWHVCGLPLGF